MAGTRAAAVSGMFYPADAGELGQSVRRYLAAVAPEEGPAPKAVIAPHAGYVYSGPIAAAAYAGIAGASARIRRVVLIGPSHRLAIEGFAAVGWQAFETPLGEVPVDAEAMRQALALPTVRVLDDAHRQEHCLEVQLPFLQSVLTDFAIVPLLAGEATAEETAELLDLLWGGPETLIVVSSDLSHYHDYHTASRLDGATSEAIEDLRPEAIGYDHACGRVPIAGLLLAAKRHGLTARTLDLRNSGDTAGGRREVVGYGAYAFA
jgi:AmmeMemoRadiSam system protein B